MPAPAPDTILTDEDVARRFHVERQIARAWMTTGPVEKRLGHFRRGRVMRTTEALLAQFLAANLQDPPRFPPRTASLERDVITRAYWLIGELVKHGRVKVVEPDPDPGEKSPIEKTAA